jgi:hypothetical protein
MRGRLGVIGQATCIEGPFVCPDNLITRLNGSSDPTISLDAEDNLLVLCLQIVDIEGIIHIVFEYERHFL